MSAFVFLFAPLTVIGAAAGTGSAQVLEEIVVVSQKREQRMQDVPLSLTYLSGSRIDDFNVNRIADAAGFVPNFTTTETGASTQMYLRGIGSGNNPGFEQSVGQYIDGVYYGRAQLIRMPFFDLQQMEVLHGPQSTLFGRNTIAGALNLLSRGPTAEPEGYVSVLHEFETGQEELTGALSGPLGETLNGRVALRLYEEDGYMRNAALQRDEPAREEQALRVMLDWQPDERLRVSLKAEQDNFDSQGRQMEILRDEPNLYPPGSTPIAGLNFAQILPLFGQPGHDTTQNFVRASGEDEFSNNELHNLTLNMQYDSGEYRLDSVTAWVDYDFDELCDCDLTAADIFTSFLAEDYEQFSQEFRLSSLPGGELSWLTGLYWQTSRFAYNEEIRVGDASMLGLVSPQLRPMLDTMAAREFHQDSDTWALFGQYAWRPLDRLTLTLGARFTRESKRGDRVVDILDIGTRQIAANPFAPVVYEQAFGIQNRQASGHQVADSRSESAFTPALTLQYEADGDTMYYASVRRGFKPGGYDARANRSSYFAFEPEDALYYELGLKTVLPGRSADLNLALHYTDYENLQISQFDGTSGFNVGNAQRSVVQGLDLSGRWYLSDMLELDYAYSYLDFEFRDFRNGNCYTRQTPDGVVVDGVPLCDYSGSRGKYTPRQRANLSLSHYLPLRGDMELHSTVDLLYTGGQAVHENLDPAFDIDSYTRLNLRLALETPRYSVALIGRNLLDEAILTYAGNVPLTESLFGTNTYYGFLERPRTVALEFRAAF